ncbi:glycosyltransferase [Allohahella marinimesophila]|uniref:Glycosyltransferase n=1 Tax=Allohahella marinimesophila TaxID=1054972 RepID=A0ABP7P0L0_9GAMM
MRIVIDMQGAQTESRYRGIGRYTMAFAHAVVRHSSNHEIFLALNGLFPETIEPIRASFEGLLPQKNVRVWDAPGPVNEESPDNAARREVTELLREAFLASLRPDIVHITSLFEGFVDDAVTSLGRFDKSTPVSVSLYDLIPFLNPDQYLLPNQIYGKFYSRKIDYLKQADLCLAISEFACNEAAIALPEVAGKSRNVSTAVTNEFAEKVICEDAINAVLNKFCLNHEFILYTGGADERKNLVRLIMAYSQLSVFQRKNHQLVFAGRIAQCDIDNLKLVAKKAGVPKTSLIFTGYITDEELVILYKTCALFVFPSWHEGFGLPALEAMACGAPVIAANTSSLPEVVGLPEALFDPFDALAIASKMSEVLDGGAFRTRLIKHGLKQAQQFSWDTTAKLALNAWEELIIKNAMLRKDCVVKGKPKLAFVSPLPPERTGIADYSAALIPELSRYYDLTLVVDQVEVDPLLCQYGEVKDLDWFRRHGAEYDYVIYQFGNSPFHKHMLSTMVEIPGVVVLHDFFLSGLMAWCEEVNFASYAWRKELINSHGLYAAAESFKSRDDAKLRWPVNGHVLQHALGVIVHSDFSIKLAAQFYNSDLSDSWLKIPLVRGLTSYDPTFNRPVDELGYTEHDFLICSFGFLDTAKLNDLLIKAFVESELSKKDTCHLVFVGENHGGDYGDSILRLIKKSGLGERIKITGYVSSDVFNQYLSRADVAVQLRTNSRGESSAAVLDCMNHGIPIIVNANGSLAELDSAAVCMLDDEFENEDLVSALEMLWKQPEKRRTLGALAREIIVTEHSPSACAGRYVKAIEGLSRNRGPTSQAVVNLIARVIEPHSLEAELIPLANAIAQNHPLPKLNDRIFLDVTATCLQDLKSGIERVARALMVSLLTSVTRHQIVPVYLSCDYGRWSYRTACRYTMELLQCPSDGFDDEVCDPGSGDIVLTLDISGSKLVDAACQGFFRSLQNRGVSVRAVVFDLLPISMPTVFPPGADIQHRVWLEALMDFNGAICISQTVAGELRDWAGQNYSETQARRQFSVDSFHLGADVLSSAPTKGLPAKSKTVLNDISSKHSFLLVGTIEPRKGYAETLMAFDKLWEQGHQVNLVIVGKEGWCGLPDDQRRDIPETVRRLSTHPELDKRLFWLSGISDEYLEKVYAASTALIAASYGEGFGLPLVEAAQHKMPIIARDIPVFREVAGKHAFYFGGDKGLTTLSEAIKEWLKLYTAGEHPTSVDMPWTTWKESAQQILDLVTSDGNSARSIKKETL